MAEIIIAPKLGLTATEVTIVKWHKNVGEAVNKGETVVEIMTEKVTYEVEAPADGVLLAALVEEDETVPMGTALGVIGAAGEDITSLLARLKGEEAAAPAAPAAAEAPAAPAPPPVPEGERVKASPAAKKFAAELGVPLEAVSGTGPGGRITLEDVEQYAIQMKEPAATPLAKKVAAGLGVELSQVAGTGAGGKIRREDVEGAAATPVAPRQEEQPVGAAEIIPFKGMRKAIAERMLASSQQTAAVTLTTEVEATQLVALRSQLLEEVQARVGVRLTYTDLLIKITAVCLRQYPRMNATLTPEGVNLLPEVNIGMATALPDGLLVPVIRNADRKSLSEIAAATKDLGRRAREGGITPDELKGGTFTVSNLGQYNIDAFSPIINLPETGILGVGRMVQKPVVVKDQIVIRPMMYLSLVFDHRIIDGAQAAEFLRLVSRCIENPGLLLA